MEVDYSKKSKVELAELAAMDFVKKNSKNGIFTTYVMAALFFRIHELSGSPLKSKYGYKEVDKGGSPFRLVVRELGPYQDIQKIAEHYKLNPEALHEEARHNYYLTTDNEDGDEDACVTFRMRESQYDLDRLLSLRANIDDNRPLKILLEKSKE